MEFVHITNKHYSIEIHKINGELVQELKIELNGITDYNYVNLVFSPSGRYFFYVEDDPDDKGEEEKDKKPDPYGYYNPQPKRPIARICEITQDRFSK
jgi:hypothetical protein